MKKFVKTRLFTLLFTITLIVSFFMGINAFAETNVFKISNATITDKSTTVSGSITDVESDEVENNFIFHQVGDYVVYKITLKNIKGNDLTIVSITDDNTNPYIVYDYDKHENEDIKDGETLDFIVEATYKNEVTDISKRNQSNNVKFIINYIDNGKEESSSIDINPKTGDKIGLIISIFVLSLIGLILSLIFGKNKKTSKVLIVLGLLLTPFVIKAASFVYDIDLISEYGLYDKEVVTYVINGVENTQVVPYNNYMTEISAPSKIGYNFVGWVKEDGTPFSFTTPISDDTKIIAKYDAITYELNIDLNGGIASNPTSYTIEDNITLSEPTKNGYTFIGWTGTDLTEPTKNVTFSGKTGDRSYTANYTATVNRINYSGITQEEAVALGNPETYTIEDSDITLINPTKVGHSFIGWTGSNGNTPQTSVTITSGSYGDKNYTANFSANSYTLSIDPNGGKYNNSTSITQLTNNYGTVITLSNPVKEGYNFAGWTLTGLGTLSDNSYTYEAGNDTVTANYSVINYDVHYEGLTSSEIAALNNPTSYNIESATITLHNPSDRLDEDGVVYERFTGWTYGDSTSSTATIPSGSTGEKTFTANFVHVDPETYTITYELHDGILSEDNPSSYTIKTPTFTLNTPTKEGYEFDGWTGSNGTTAQTVVTIEKGSTGDRDYEANYSTIDYNISYTNLTDAEISSYSLPTDYNIETNTFTLPTLSKNGYTFLGWTGSNGDTPGSVTITKGTIGEKTYTANFSLIDYDIDYELNGGTVSGNPTIYNIETGVIVLVNPTKTGYTFTGWSGTDLTGNDNTSVTIPSGSIGDREYEAHFTANKYYVSFNANASDATGSMTNQEFTYDVSDTLTDNAYVRSGYIFNGWNTDPDGLGTSYTNMEEVTNILTSGTITLYAQWIEDLVTVSFDSNGGNSVSSITVRRGQSASLPTPTNDDATKTFVGWFEDLEDTTPVSSTYTVTADIELIAKWSAIICKKATSLTTATCNINGGTNGCPAAGYAYEETIEYGNVNRSDSYNVGDAFDCNVDGSGFTYRFYYLRTNDDKAVLIFNNNFEGANGISDVNNFAYNEALTMLPTTTQWNNLPTTYGEYAARFPSWDDLSIASGNSNLTSSNALKDLPFIYENIGKFTTADGRSTVWIEAVNEGGTLTGYRYHVNGLKLQTGAISGTNPSKNCVRPVIEVPLDLIEDDYVVKYDAIPGSLTNKYALVSKGTALTSLPTPTYIDHSFDAWYDSPLFDTVIDENHVPNGYETYYAKYLKNVNAAVLDYDEYDLTIGETDTITFVDEVNVEPKTYASNNDSIATVDVNGNITAINEGTTSIVITGSLSGTTKVVTVKVQAEAVSCTIEFDENGGSSVSDMIVTKNTTFADAGGLPTTSLTDYVFAGWFTDNTYAREVTNSTVVKGDMILVAKWIPSNAVAEVNGTYYSTLADAITNAPANGTVIIVKDFTLENSIDIKKDINIDLNGKTVTSTGRAFQIYSRVEVGNGTITTSGGSGIFDVVTDSTHVGDLTLNSGSYINTRTANTRKQGVYVNGGIARIGGTAYIKSNADGNATPARATVQCLGGGTIYITGGTIVNEHTSVYSFAVANSNGTVIIGKEDGVYDTTTPVIKGYAYGLKSNNDAKFSIYDGIIMGGTAAIDNEANIDGIESGATKINGTDGNYNTLYYQMPDNQITITLDTDGGSLPQGASDYIVLNDGDEVGNLPTPTKGVYTFDGWFDENDQEVLSTRVPTQNETYHAVWSYSASSEVINFNMDNDIMSIYFANIDSWKVDETTFQSNLDTYFDSYNCSKCTGPYYQECPAPETGKTLCDQPKGYDTGVSDALVYESDEVNKNKGNLVSYTTVTDGVIYNMIPGQTYYWESSSDSNVYGLVKASGTRRVISSSVRNVRDLGGLTVDYNEDGTSEGTLNYGLLYRGVRLSTNADKNSLSNLGIVEEFDLRAASDGTNEPKLSTYKQKEIINYKFDTYSSTSEQDFKDALTTVMQDVSSGNSVYFHCKIGTDRTGTMAYFLEGLLGVPKEQKLEDYDLSYFYGLLNRTRFHDNLSGSSINPRFTSMVNRYPDNVTIYNWYTSNGNDTTAVNTVNAFRSAMVKTN